MRFSLTTILSLVALAALTTVPAQAAITFNFQFDNTGNSTLEGTIVGTGTVVLPSDPGNGLFNFTDVSPVISFTVNGNTFTNANIASNPALVNVFISSSVAGRQFQFANDGGSGGGPFGGSLDFVNSGKALSFQPSNSPVSGSVPNLYFANPGGLGTYRGLAANVTAPEPGSFALLALGATGFIVRRKRRAV